MYNVVKIGDKDVPMLAMASANIYYKRVFGRDAIILQADAQSDGERIAFYGEMGYIMAAMAEAKGDKAKLSAMSFDGYIDWLSQFDNGDYTNAIYEIAKTYEGQTKPTSKAKKETAR